MSFSGLRPQNDLLQVLSEEAFGVLKRFFDTLEVTRGQVLVHPGDPVQDVYFPCGPGFVSLSLYVDEDREVEVALIGSEGAAGDLTLSGPLPSFARLTVKAGGRLIRLASSKLAAQKQEAAELQQLLLRYSLHLQAQIGQSSACNAAHSIEQRTAKWLVKIAEFGGGKDSIALTHEELSSLLGVRRSYASRVIDSLRRDGLLSTGRGAVHILDRSALEQKACRCNKTWKMYCAELST